jgi:hypothetical protein
MPSLLLVIEPLGQRRERSADEGRTAYAQMQQYAARLTERGLLRAADSLAAEATRLQLRDGAPRLLDGPFAEAKEMVGGYFLLDCEEHEQALALAAECPAAAWATIEVRRIAPCYD